MRPGEPIPEGIPRRYANGSGYIRLRWKVGKGQYVETYEHRIACGVEDERHVHHINGIKSDNVKTNLAPLSPTEHIRVHGTKFDVEQMTTLYQTGLSCKEVGQAIGADPATVWRSLARSGVALRSELRIAIPKREQHKPVD